MLVQMEDPCKVAEGVPSRLPVPNWLCNLPQKEAAPKNTHTHTTEPQKEAAPRHTHTQDTKPEQENKPRRKAQKSTSSTRSNQR